MICKKHNEEKCVAKSGKKFCRSCNREAQRIWWHKNKEQQQDKVKQNRNKIKDFVFEIRSGAACIICGENNPLAIDFDHLENKEYNVSQMARMGLKKTIEAEVAKCQILCSNYHRIKTHMENNSYTYQKVKDEPKIKEICTKLKALMNLE